MELPDNRFDYSYSVGVLHHTGDPLRGFQEMVRVTKPGGVVIVSLYNRYSRFLLNVRQKVCKLLGGDDIEARVRWGQRLFPFATRRLNRRYHGLNYKAVLYDSYGCPHETLHSAGEVLRWFDKSGVRYIGSFAPLRVQDYLYLFSLPEYRLAGDGLAKLTGQARWMETNEFPRPSWLNALLCQLMWVPFGLRISCFTLAGRKE
jgi:SAM-dependent methyltransferase